MTLVDFCNLLINGTIEGLLIALPALALTLVMGVARFPNAATGDYMTVSAYAGIGVQALGATSIVVAGLGAVAAGAAISVVFYLWVFRALRGRPPVASLVAAIGVAFFSRSMLTLFVGHDQQTFNMPLVRAWNFGGVRLLPTDLYVAAIALIAMALLFALLHLTPIGRQMRAIADNPDLARACGIRSGRVLLALWAVVGALCALGGMMFGIKAVVSPELGWELLIPAFAAMILGGIGSPLGAVAGGVLLGIASELSVPFVGPSYKIAVAFALLLLVLLLRPRGLFGKAIAAR
ncbi:MAG: branched-chain amino acid ABC transporter permease [Betaproteobacteria bacterium]|nr:branched-chain amino acid ABC transporter permease [Betaproteobacteria bacterium]